MEIFYRFVKRFCIIIGKQVLGPPERLCGFAEHSFLYRLAVARRAGDKKIHTVFAAFVGIKIISVRGFEQGERFTVGVAAVSGYLFAQKFGNAGDIGDKLFRLCKYSGVHTLEYVIPLFAGNAVCRVYVPGGDRFGAEYLFVPEKFAAYRGDLCFIHFQSSSGYIPFSISERTWFTTLSLSS